MSQSAKSLYDSGKIPVTVPSLENDADASGTVSSYQPAGGTTTATNAFFQSLGTNGRSCITCHQPPSAMSVSVANIQARYTATSGLDPIFVPVDGADCPASVTSQGQPSTAYSMLLNRGLFRIALAVPVNANYTLTVVSDPLGCNLNPTYNQTVNTSGQTQQVVSVYRRPVMSANMAFVTASTPIAPSTRQIPPAIMWDGRETTLAQQAIDATLGHAQALTAPTTAQVNQMVAFENGIFSAQSVDKVGGKLNGSGATGGPMALQAIAPGNANNRGSMSFFTPWSSVTGTTAPALMMQSVLRGQNLFNSKIFTLNEVAGFSANQFTCSSCHTQIGNGNDVHGAHGLLDTGVSGTSASIGGNAPDPTLPIFQMACKAPNSTQYLGPTVLTNDPGTAITSGHCQDTGKFKIAPMRGLAARAPYFHDGSAAALTDVVNFYNKRFNIGFAAQDIQDVANYLNSL